MDVLNPDIDADTLPSEVSNTLITNLGQIFEPLNSKSPTSSKWSYKVKLFIQLVNRCVQVGDNILVFSHSIPTLNFLEKVLGEKKYKFVRLDGQTKVNVRQDMMKKFNAGMYNIFLISTRAGGLGYNLPGANRIILFDFHWNPTWEEQAIGRAYRLGQEKPVYVYRFYIGGTFEEELMNNAVFKIQLAYRVVEKKNIKSQAEKAKQWLVTPQDVAQEDLEEHRGKDVVLDKILKQQISGDAFIRDIRTTETLQQEDDEPLTEADLAEIEKEIELEKTRIEDPEKYRAKEIHDQLALLQPEDLATMRSTYFVPPTTSSAPVSNTVGMSTLPSPSSMNVPRTQWSFPAISSGILPPSAGPAQDVSSKFEGPVGMVPISPRQQKPNRQMPQELPYLPENQSAHRGGGLSATHTESSQAQDLEELARTAAAIPNYRTHWTSGKR
jgi:superfamily II DNA/RNA helicase